MISIWIVAISASREIRWIFSLYGQPASCHFLGDEIDGIEEVDPITGVTIAPLRLIKIYPANLFHDLPRKPLHCHSWNEKMTWPNKAFFESIGKEYEAKTIVWAGYLWHGNDQELGHCSGIENYSRYFDGRAAGTRPYCLLDFFPGWLLLVIDESHVSVPQVRAMYGGRPCP